MTAHCHYCNKDLDTAHDEHYACGRNHRHPVVCTQCHMSHERCAECGASLQYRDASYQKRLFEEPGARGLLGF